MASLLAQRNFLCGVEADVGVLAGAARLTVAPVGEQLELALRPGRAVDVRPAPRIVRQRLLEEGLDRRQSFLAGRIAAVLQAVLVERLLEGIDLRSRHLGLGFADLREVARGDVAGEQPDDHDHDQQLEQREAALAFGHGRAYCVMAQLAVAHTPPPELVPVPVLEALVKLDPDETSARTWSALYLLPVGSATMVGERSRTLRAPEPMEVPLQL